MTWDKETVQKAIRMHTEGYSMSQVGEAIGKSKGAVCGFMWRQGLSKSSNNNLAMRSRKKSKLKDKSYKGKGIKLMDLKSNTCRWPLWKDGDNKKLYCGTTCDKTYCKKHSELAYATKRWKDMYLEPHQRKDNLR
jgi:hypothetical protein